MNQITWKKRRIVERSDVGESKILESQCGRYRVRHPKFTLGPTSAEIRQARRAGDKARAADLERKRMPDMVYAQRLDRFGDCMVWTIVSRHRSPEAARTAIAKLVES